MKLRMGSPVCKDCTSKLACAMIKDGPDLMEDLCSYHVTNSFTSCSPNTWVAALTDKDKRQFGLYFNTLSGAVKVDKEYREILTICPLCQTFIKDIVVGTLSIVGHRIKF